MLLRWFLFVVTIGLLAAPPPADAVLVRARLPAVALTGARIRVPGRVSGTVAVRLERRAGRRWARAGGRRRFPLMWRAPRAAGLVRLRVVALRRGRVVAATPPRGVAVSATRVLAASRIEAAGPRLVRYDGRVAVRVGQFVASGVGPHTPYGQLGRVVAVRHAGG